MASKQASALMYLALHLKAHNSKKTKADRSQDKEKFDSFIQASKLVKSLSRAYKVRGAMYI